VSLPDRRNGSPEGQLVGRRDPQRGRNVRPTVAARMLVRLKPDTTYDEKADLKVRLYESRIRRSALSDCVPTNVYCTSTIGAVQNATR
jgi:hypothetical protein